VHQRRVVAHHVDQLQRAVACLAQRVISWSLGLIGYLFYLRMKGVDRVPTPAERALAEG